MFFQTNCSQSIKWEIIKDIRADAPKEFINQSEHGCSEEDAIFARDTAVPHRDGAEAPFGAGDDAGRHQHRNIDTDDEDLMIYVTWLILSYSQNQCGNQQCKSIIINTLLKFW